MKNQTAEKVLTELKKYLIEDSFDNSGKEMSDYHKGMDNERQDILGLIEEIEANIPTNELTKEDSQRPQDSTNCPVLKEKDQNNIFIPLTIEDDFKITLPKINISITSTKNNTLGEVIGITLNIKPIEK